MSSDTIISVENLSKKYRLRHQNAERYTALRDVVAQQAKRPWQWVAQRFGNAEKLKKGNPPSEPNNPFASSDVSVSASQRVSVSSTEDFWALKDVSFEVKRGEVVGIIGRNGAGKSTLLKILSRITEPTTGRITLRGRVASLLEVGTGFHPELTGRENIFLNGAILGMSRIEIRKKFDEIVAFAEVENFLDTPVKRYSSGMYVRLAFAVAAHMEPEILIVDEVLAVGDAAFQKKCVGKMEEAAKESGRTVLFVSHNLGTVRSLCSRSIYLKAGSVVEDGAAARVIEIYASDTQTTDAHIVGQDGFSIQSVVLRDRAGSTGLNFASGGEIIVEINYFVSSRIEHPYFWLEVFSMHGATFGACMLFDGIRPKWIEGSGRVTCHFQYLPLMPGGYTIRMGARRQNGTDMLMRSQDVGFFNITTSLSEMGLHGELADTLSVDAAPVVLPYTWHLPDGTSEHVEIRSGSTSPR